MVQSERQSRATSAAGNFEHARIPWHAPPLCFWHWLSSFGICHHGDHSQCLVLRRLRSQPAGEVTFQRALQLCSTFNHQMQCDSDHLFLLRFSCQSDHTLALYCPPGAPTAKSLAQCTCPQWHVSKRWTLSSPARPVSLQLAANKCPWMCCMYISVAFHWCIGQPPDLLEMASPRCPLLSSC